MKETTDFAKALKAWRKKKHLSQAQAAAQFSTPLDTYRKWEQGTHAPIGLAWDAAWKILLGLESNKGANQ